MNERRQVKVMLCARCTTTLRDLQSNHGAEAMRSASQRIVAQCPDCSRQLPDELRLQLLANLGTVADA